VDNVEGGVVDDNWSSSTSTSYQGSTSSSCSNLLIDKLYDWISTSYQGSTSSSCSNLLIDKLYNKGFRKLVLGRGEAPLNFWVG
jgi:hypothetical protein